MRAWTRVLDDGAHPRDSRARVSPRRGAASAAAGAGGGGRGGRGGRGGGGGGGARQLALRLVVLVEAGHDAEVSAAFGAVVLRLAP